MAQQDLQLCVRMRTRHVHARVAVANQLRSFLAEYGVIVAKSLKNLRAGMPVLLEHDLLTPTARRVGAELYAELLALDEKIAQADRVLVEALAAHPAYPRLQTVPGIGPVVAASAWYCSTATDLVADFMQSSPSGSPPVAPDELFDRIDDSVVMLMHEPGLPGLAGDHTALPGVPGWVSPLSDVEVFLYDRSTRSAHLVSHAAGAPPRSLVMRDPCRRACVLMAAGCNFVLGQTRQSRANRLRWSGICRCRTVRWCSSGSLAVSAQQEVAPHLTRTHGCASGSHGLQCKQQISGDAGTTDRDRPVPPAALPAPAGH